MGIAARRTLRFTRAWMTERAAVAEREITVSRGALEVPATLIRPRRGDRKLPAWVVLHGITRPGRRHEQLRRFTRALASTGSVAIVPEVPEWLALDLAPHLTVPTVEAALETLGREPRPSPGRVGLMGFSFGAPHAIAAAGAPSLRGRVSGVVGFGGYCDLLRTVRFMLTGRHDWEGRSYELRPDPYGRWIVAANYLTAVPGYEDATDVTQALRRLAAHTGDVRTPAWDRRYDGYKEELRSSIEVHRRALFDLFAPPSDQEPERTEGEEMAAALAAAAARVDPGIDPGPALGRVEVPVHVLHGRQDHLIPFTEGLRLRSRIAPGTWSRATVTRLFGHSEQDPFPGPLESMREGFRFLKALNGILGVA